MKGALVQKTRGQATQVAGENSTQSCWNNSTQTAGVGTVQKGMWHDEGGVRVATRVVTKRTADKAYLFKNKRINK